MFKVCVVYKQYYTIEVDMGGRLRAYNLKKLHRTDESVNRKPSRGYNISIIHTYTYDSYRVKAVKDT